MLAQAGGFGQGHPVSGHPPNGLFLGISELARFSLHPPQAPRQGQELQGTPEAVRANQPNGQTRRHAISRVVAASLAVLATLSNAVAADLAATPAAASADYSYVPGSFGGSAGSLSRIKDLVDIEGVRENQLIGYGLVVGLDGTGDSLNNAPFTRQSLQAMLERLGVNTRDTNMRTANVAAVMVTANLRAFSTQGTRMDVNVSALGDSSSLQGGTLLVTPLLGADGEVYAVAQGPVAIGGFSAQGEAASVTRGVPTTGRIANGALVEREIEFHLGAQSSLRLALRNPDLTTAKRIEATINAFIGARTARATDPATIQLTVPRSYPGDLVSLLTEIEQLRVEPDQVAKVIIDEQAGIIVMGHNVRVSEVAVAQGNLTVTIAEAPQVSQPAPFSDGVTAIVPRTDIGVDDESGNRMAIVPNNVSLQQLVDGLNALGIGPRDLISILQAIKAAGALQAEIEVM
ncbi:flagellar basal body P-ring protein FlgI [Lutibaculum baratangense]|uniref:Flagellar P-ring protein n=1 Tax=Lutibaculum baratangense AMV1 TaxID=631454 RepID=V4RUL8_9HYPH|nr:flagellar basal body P-ring protein FlgI [Lutibaculum baratangense]ESR26770.1 Flagellar P-ring protein FlgI [Lutibaculum baratangense AMV1]